MRYIPSRILPLALLAVGSVGVAKQQPAAAAQGDAQILERLRAIEAQAIQAPATPVQRQMVGVMRCARKTIEDNLGGADGIRTVAQFLSIIK